MYCNQCKQNAPAGAGFCPFCGGGLTENPSTKESVNHEEPNEATYQASRDTALKLSDKTNLFGRFIENSSKVKTAFIVAGLLVVLLAGLNIFQLTSSATLKVDNATLESDIYAKNDAINDLKAEISTLESDLYNAEIKADFLDDSIALVADDGTNLYHTYDCIYFQGGYWAYNNEMAEYEGYYPCPYCH